MSLNIISPSDLSFFPLTDVNPKELPSLSREELKRCEKVLDENQSVLEKPFPFGPKGTNPADMLAKIAENQKQVVNSMWSSYSLGAEAAIAMALRASIEAYAEKLEAMQRWTNGGKDAFDEALNEMAKDYMSDNPSGMDMENLFQIILMKIMSEKPVPNWLNKNGWREKIFHFLESTGSGSHGVHIGWNGSKFATEFDSLFKLIEAEYGDTEPFKGWLNSIDKNALSKQFENNYESDKEAFGIGADTPLSPMLRLAILSELLKKGDISKEEVSCVLHGNRKKLNELIAKKTGYEDALDFLFESDGELGWQNQEKNTEGKESRDVVDWADQGDGLDPGYFEDLYANFPERELTKEELEEINRIGDMVKMLNETLKYWISTLNDERLSIVRNL